MTRERLKLSRMTSVILTSFILVTPFLAVADDSTKGEEIFFERCAKCHGFEGEGFSDIYPAIQDSSFLKENAPKLPCIIREGSKGELSKRKSEYDQIMPATKDVSPTEIGQLITFMQTKWEHPVTKLDVETLLQECEKEK